MQRGSDPGMLCSRWHRGKGRRAVNPAQGCSGLDDIWDYSQIFWIETTRGNAWPPETPDDLPGQQRPGSSQPCSCISEGGKRWSPCRVICPGYHFALTPLAASRHLSPRHSLRLPALWCRTVKENQLLLAGVRPLHPKIMLWEYLHWGFFSHFYQFSG